MAATAASRLVAGCSTWRVFRIYRENCWMRVKSIPTELRQLVVLDKRANMDDEQLSNRILQMLSVTEFVLGRIG